MNKKPFFLLILRTITAVVGAHPYIVSEMGCVLVDTLCREPNVLGTGELKSHVAFRMRDAFC